MRGKRIATIVIGALVVVGAYAAFKDDIAALWDNLHVKIAEYPQPTKTVWLDQGIAKEKLSWFYHADQGTRTFGFPYEWFMALEQPTIPWLILTKVDDFSESTYLDRYGFIPDTIIPGKKALPIGFAKGGPMLDPSGAPWKNPRTKETMNGAGLSCAACHTGRFTYKDTAVVIDGGPALTNLLAMKQGMGVALLLTRFIPTRFNRFAGVSAELNLTNPSKGLYKSSVNVESLFEMEQMIKGNALPNAKDGFSGLRSPKWPADILPPIDQKLADKGAELYKTHCQECHRPPVSSAAFYDFNNKDWWTKNEAGEPILKVENVPISHIGTDPAQAADMISRTVALPANLGIDKSGFADALGAVVAKTVNYVFDQKKPPVSPAERRRIDGYMPNELRGELAYKVRPLNGVWATPPYLHNGSVPTVEALLGPPEDRPKKFYLGNREYDPVNLGYKFDKIANGFEFDTSIRGNSNRGHEFRKDFSKDKEIKGVIGPALSADDRKALIEYLKTL